MWMRRFPRFGALLLLFCAQPVAAPPRPQVQTRAESEVVVARGVTYSHYRAQTPAGEPWSIHVLKISRHEKSVAIRAVAGQGPGDEMQRMLPTEMARQTAQAGANVLAVVNGDYDLGAPYLGISDGLAVTSERLWTTGKPTWPAMVLLRSGEPVIAVPQMHMKLAAGKQQWVLGALNKPLGSGHGPEPRAFTREYRTTLKSDRAFRALVIEKLSPPLPLRVNRAVRGVVLENIERATEVTIPPDAIVLAERLKKENAGGSETRPYELKPGTKVKLSFDVRMDRHKNVREVVGGFPILVQDARRSITGETGEYLSRRHPRTAACYNAREIIFVVVDGRQPQLSVGMTLEELADWMVSLGCTVAMNTDGGGSSVMAVTQPSTTAGAASSAPTLQIVNSPSDGRERGRGNAWVVVTKP